MMLFRSSRAIAFCTFAGAGTGILCLRMLKNAPLTIAGRQFQSRLLVGTGKFSSPEAMRDALLASGTQIVTVALRRADLSGKKDPFANILEFVDPDRYLLLPNTSGALRSEEHTSE